jgi:hypothetical protein
VAASPNAPVAGGGLVRGGRDNFETDSISLIALLAALLVAVGGIVSSTLPAFKPRPAGAERPQPAHGSRLAAHGAKTARTAPAAQMTAPPPTAAAATGAALKVRPVMRYLELMEALGRAAGMDQAAPDAPPAVDPSLAPKTPDAL